MTKRQLLIIALAVVVCAGAGAGAAWWLTHSKRPADTLTLFGNVDLRQIELAFNDSERISAVLVQEGDRLAKGQVVARLDVSRLQPEMAQVEAQTAAQQAVVDRMHAGNRPQEIAQAKAGLAAAQADALVAQGQYQRAASLWSATSGRAAVSRQDVDNAKAAADAAAAKLESQQKAYELELIGPRREDIAQAEAQLSASQAQLVLLKQQLADAQLVAPIAGVVRARLMEPGEMATPQRPVFTIAETDPKWVRAYVNETDLPRLHPGMAASVTVDGFSSHAYKGWVGFISSVAEFTPKTVQTPELRTSLVYEVRVFVIDPSDDLRLGMPATVHIHLAPADGSGR
ncbi:MAG: HlyD family efflux transporter periplasmic adaptor subunit [Caulobacteraceae bacterium]|nr:HlyD family efflux transporter periplasmic adaptor subunit [Caulobacteraceae bacterium]